MKRAPGEAWPGGGRGAALGTWGALRSGARGRGSQVSEGCEVGAVRFSPARVRELREDLGVAGPARRPSDGAGGLRAAGFTRLPSSGRCGSAAGSLLPPLGPRSPLLLVALRSVNGTAESRGCLWDAGGRSRAVGRGYLADLFSFTKIQAELCCY